LLHELAHKYVATRYGAHARYETWTLGLILMLALAIIPQLFGFPLPLFLAPGAVMIYAMKPMSRQEAGLISLAGPATNIALAVIFLLLALGLFGVAAFSEQAASGEGYVLPLVMLMGVRVNLFLAMFNLLPIFPLDGSKVVAWDWKIWLAAFAIAFLGSGMFGM
jgi:Zn-dependent protease